VGDEKVSGEEIKHTKDSLKVVRKAWDKKKAILLDVRTPREWKKGHVKGAIHFPLRELTKIAKGKNAKKRLEKLLPKAKGMVIYCHCQSGVRSLYAAELLLPLGYDIRALKPGYPVLISNGFPNETVKDDKKKDGAKGTDDKR